MLFRVDDCQPTGWLAQVTYTDLLGLNEEQAGAAVLARVAPGRAKPAVPVPYPGVGAPAPRNVPAHPPYPAAAEDLLRLRRVRAIALDWRAEWSARAADLEAAAEVARAAQRHPAAGASAAGDAARQLALDAGHALSALPKHELDHAEPYGLNIHLTVRLGSAIALAKSVASAPSAEVDEYDWENVARVLESALSLTRFDIGALPCGFAVGAQAPGAVDLCASGPLILLHNDDEPGHLELLAPLPNVVPLARLAARALPLTVLAARLNPGGALEVVAADDQHLYGWWGSAAVPTHQRARGRPLVAAAFVGNEAGAPVVVVQEDGKIDYFGPDAPTITLSPPRRPSSIVDAAVWVDDDAGLQHWTALLIGSDGECIAVDEQCRSSVATLWDDPLFRDRTRGMPPRWTHFGGVERGRLDGFECALVWRISMFEDAAICFVDPATLRPLREPLLVERAIGRIQGLALAGGRWLLATTIQDGPKPSSRLLVFDLARHGPAAAQPVAGDGTWHGDLYGPLVVSESRSGFCSLQVKRDFDSSFPEPGQTLLRYDWPDRRLTSLLAGSNLRTALVAGSEAVASAPSGMSS